MTQVTNLGSMMGNAVRASSSSKKEQHEALIEEFAGIMNQNAQSFLNPSSDYRTDVDAMSDDLFSGNDRQNTMGVSQKDYEKLGASGNRNIVKAETGRTTDATAVSEKVHDLAEDVQETVQETMQVSEEEIEQAMDALGFEVMDLLQPQNLIQLVQTLTGSEDVSALLTNENFQLTMQEVTGLIADFQQAQGLSPVQFTDLLQQLSAEIDKLEEAVKDLLNIDDASQTEQMISDGNEVPEELTKILETSDETGTFVSEAGIADRQTMNVQTTESETQQSGEPVAEQPLMETVDQTGKEAAQTDGGEEHGASQGEKNRQPFQHTTEQSEMFAEQHAGVVGEHPVMTQETMPLQSAQPQQMASYVQVEQLMEQMEGLARAFASTEGTTLEMQLNPENLGKLVLTVTEKHGNVTAQITASNEQVKEVLQTQLAELRATLQTQGIKVEAVEVTVATHEFEQNLDGNSAANGQMQEQTQGQSAQGQGGRRNLNRNSLDELSGLMSEEEALVAQMMRDNGGTVDFTA